MSHKPVLITLLRHGAVAGRSHIFRGSLDEPLSAHGMTQMNSILHLPFDAIACSPRQRCCAPAAVYAAQHDLPLQILPAFAELHFGDWEGFTPDEALARDPVQYQQFRTHHAAPPNGESLAQLRLRVAYAWEHWLAQTAGNNRLLISHAGVMRALLMELFGWTPAQAFQIALPEAASLKISCLTGHPPFLLSLNPCAA